MRDLIKDTPLEVGRDREKNGLAEKDRHRHKKKKRESELGEFECPIS